MGKMIEFLIVIFALGWVSPAYCQTAVRGECIQIVGLPAAVTPNPDCFQNMTIPVYSQAVIDTKLKQLDVKIENLSGDAVKAIKKTVDEQAIKADDVERIVKATRDQIYVQLKNDITKAVKDAVTKSIQEQVAAEVKKQLADKNKPQ